MQNLSKLLELFFAYKRPEIDGFRRAIVQFAEDLPAVLKALRDRIDSAYATNKAFAKAARDFLRTAKETINPSVEDADIREMLIQHILTEDIFARIFGDSDFHQENNVAKALYGLEKLFFRGNIKQQTLHALEPYYAAIRSTAALIRSHSEKQGFLKAIYGNFYKVYNPNAADRLGVVYTPTEIVRFLVESTDWLCERHFQKSLIDKNVEILDPATGTGTFIVELLEYFRGRPKDLKFKYANELHANEVAILPYYVANLNIEATFAALTEHYAEFPNLCFVDTLDNTAALKSHVGQQFNLLGGISTENSARIKRQNDRKISVIIGNPPYNANQQNENDNNKNREYPEIDQRIKDTYVKESTATRTNVYDMYSRFLRWATDRIEENGIIAFVTNRGFLDQRSFDGFRAIAEREFNELWVLDLKGDARTAGEARRRQGGNVFGDQIRVGIAVYCFVRKKGTTGFSIHHESVPDYAKADDKIEFLRKPLRDRTMTVIRPDSRHLWLNQTETSFQDLLPLVAKETKATKIAGQEQAIFKLFSLGVVTNRDDWVYGSSDTELRRRVKYLIAAYNREVGAAKKEEKTKRTAPPSNTIKWTRLVKSLLDRRVKMAFSEELLADCTYRPFNRRRLYFSKQLNEVQYRLPDMFGPAGRLRVPTIVWSDPTSQKTFMCLATDGLYDLHLVGAACGSFGAAKRVATDAGDVENVTDWALERFTSHYGAAASITKDRIFSYVYAVLHNPQYRSTYAINLKQDLPRIPFYADFAQWADWGQKLLDLHLGYEEAEPFPLKEINAPDKRLRATGQTPHVILRADKAKGEITLDTETRLEGVPASAWDYVLGNRAAIDWILDQHKEKTSKDPVIRTKFKPYSFADHKAEVVHLLKRVITVSVKTVEILTEMQSQGAVEAAPAQAQAKNIA